MRTAKIVLFPTKRVAVTVVRDCPAPREADMLREEVVDLGLVRLEGAAARAWTAWAEGQTHEMPNFQVKKKDYKQYVVNRWDSFQAKLKEKAPELPKWPEHHALRWSKAEVHLPPPLFIPGWHEQLMKRERQKHFWDGLEVGADLREWPEYQNLAKSAGFHPDDVLPVITLKRPQYMPAPRATASKSAKRRYRRLQERYEGEYGLSRKVIIKALQRELKKLRQAESMAV